MIVFRLGKLQYVRDLSGHGAEKSGGRWNSKGIPVLYTSQSRALCMAEVAVHLPLGILPIDYQLATIEFPENASLFELPMSNLPATWKSFPHPHATQQIGDRFIREGKYLILKVPSVVVPGDFNYLINPRHSDFTHVRLVSVEPFGFDERLFVK